jgi:hypothetical protein
MSPLTLTETSPAHADRNVRVTIARNHRKVSTAPALSLCPTFREEIK